MNIIRAYCIVCFMTLLLCQPNRVGAQVPIPSPSKQTYETVINRIFPRDVGDFSNVNKSFVLILRFVPAFSAGSQVSITAFKDGTYDIVHYSLENPNRSIWHRLIDIIQEMGREDVDEMVKRLNARSRRVKVETGTKRLLQQLSGMRLPLSLDTSLTLDATQYDLWYVTISNSLHLSLAGSEMGTSRKDHPLVRWMAEMRQSVENSGDK